MIISAALALGELGKHCETAPAVEALAKCLRQGAQVADVRRAAAAALLNLGDLAAEAVEDLEGCTTDDDLFVRSLAAAALENLKKRNSALKRSTAFIYEP